MVMRNCDPHPESVPYPIIRPRVGTAVRFTCLSRHIFGIDTHYGNGGTYYCPGPRSCDTCKRGGVARYQGYVMGRGEGSGVTAIIHLTASAAAFIEPLGKGERGLIGLRLSLIRSSGVENSEVQAQPLGWEEDMGEFCCRRFSALMHSIYRFKDLQDVVPEKD